MLLLLWLRGRISRTGREGSMDGGAGRRVMGLMDGWLVGWLVGWYRVDCGWVRL
jgi:hypothetical protein